MRNYNSVVGNCQIFKWLAFSIDSDTHHNTWLICTPFLKSMLDCDL